MPLVAALTVVLLVAVACTSGGDRADESPRTDASSLRGGTLRVAVPDLFASDDLDPQRAYDSLSWGLFRCCLLRTLYSYNGRPTEEGGAIARPDLAAGQAEVSSDGLTWTFAIREGVRYAPPFEDTAITAVDVVRALERTARVTSPAVGYPFYYDVIRGFEEYASGQADSIIGLETPDQRTLVVRLVRVTNDLPYRFSLAATAPIPEGADDGHDADYGAFLVASGPYMVEGSPQLDFSLPPADQEPATGFEPPVFTQDGAVETPGSLNLVRNPSWDPAADRLRAAFADQIEISIGGSDEDLASRVDAGDLDVAFGGSSPFEQVDRYRDDPALEDRLFEYPNDVGFAVSMNLAVPPFDDVHVRRAVAYAIDKAALVEIVSRPPHIPIGHTAEVATTIAPDSLEGGLLRAFDPYPHDLAEARAEMRASAYDRTGDGRCDAGACRNVQALVMDAAVIPEQARSIRADLAGVGIDLELDMRPISRYFGDQPELYSGSVHDPRAQIPLAIPYPWQKDYPDGAGWFEGLFSRSGLGGSNTSLLGASPSQLRKWGYSVTSVPSVDDRIQECLIRRGVAKTECWAELDQYLMTEVVSRVPYMFLEHAQVVSERVVAYSFDQFSALPALDRIALAPGSA
jgi:peptide/nickel transport system substrate-binding protein